jgi:hypothetical protein
MTSPVSGTDPLELTDFHFRQLLADCRQLYAHAAADAWQQSPQSCGSSVDDWMAKLDALHSGLLIKVFFAVVEADRVWTVDKERLSQSLIQHVWQTRLEGQALRDAVLSLSHETLRLSWSAVVGPFDRILCLREQIPALETLVMRLANLVAKSDGKVSTNEAARLRSIQEELHRQLRPLTLDENDALDPDELIGGTAVEEVLDSESVPHVDRALPAPLPSYSEPLLQGEAALKEALAELEGLIGLARIKSEVRTLSNFLAVQQQRIAAGLPQTTISLHMVFGGNPGTGKTTVARIVARIYAAMGVLKKGQLIETDRSGLVARYAGQTASLAHKKIDSAVDGMLFVDEAYSLVADEGEDAFGHEALQVLVKRLEDDRHRLVVVLAGYCEPMNRLVAANAGLASRFSTRLVFDDYSPAELGRIFQLMCENNHYVLPPATQARLLAAFAWLFQRRDEHFGNGRLVRNVFERAIRRLANRIAGIAPVTRELLTVLEPDDIEVEGVPPSAVSDEALASLKFEMRCPGCQAVRKLTVQHLGRRVQCKKCSTEFLVDWPEIAEATGKLL